MTYESDCVQHIHTDISILGNRKSMEITLRSPWRFPVGGLLSDLHGDLHGTSNRRVSSKKNTGGGDDSKLLEQFVQQPPKKNPHVGQ